MTDIKVGLVGCGVISTAHLQGWKKAPGCTVQGVFDLNRGLAEKRAREFGISRTYDTLDAVIAANDVVDVCTPPQTHSQIAQQVIGAGRHLVIEKPLVTDVADWDKLLALLSHSTGKIAVIHNLKYSLGVSQAKRWVDEGRIGTVIRIQREFLTHPQSDRMLVGNTHWSHTLPGGRWFETLPHELYLTHYFVGALELAGVTVVSTPSAPPGAPADEVLVTLKDNRCLASVHFSANCLQNRRVFTVQGTRGHITVDLLGEFAVLSTIRDTRNKRTLGGLIALEAGQQMIQWVPNRLSYLANRLAGETPHSRLIRAFAAYLQGAGPSPTPIEEVDYVVRKCDAIGREIDRRVAR